MTDDADHVADGVYVRCPQCKATLSPFLYLIHSQGRISTEITRDYSVWDICLFIPMYI